MGVLRPCLARSLPELTEAFAAVYGTSPWVWKDPRTCLTFPLWRRVIGAEPTVVIVLRDPGAVVASVKRRDGIPSLYTVGLWHHYVRAAVAGSVGLPVVCLRFEDLVASPAAAVEDPGRGPAGPGPRPAAATPARRRRRCRARWCTASRRRRLCVG